MLSFIFFLACFSMAVTSPPGTGVVPFLWALALFWGVVACTRATQGLFDVRSAVRERVLRKIASRPLPPGALPYSRRTASPAKISALETGLARMDMEEIRASIPPAKSQAELTVRERTALHTPMHEAGTCGYCDGRRDAQSAGARPIPLTRELMEYLEAQARSHFGVPPPQIQRRANPAGSFPIASIGDLDRARRAALQYRQSGSCKCGHCNRPRRTWD